MSSLLKTTSKRDLIIDRAQRLPKPEGLLETVPRDAIIRVHFFHIKEEMMQIIRRSPALPEPYQNLKMFADLPQHTIQARKRLQPIMFPIQVGFSYQADHH